MENTGKHSLMPKEERNKKKGNQTIRNATKQYHNDSQCEETRVRVSII